jgi:hypothetical protein
VERQKWEGERESRRRPREETFMRTAALAGRLQEEVGPSALEKSLKQLKDEYLRNLGHR